MSQRIYWNYKDDDYTLDMNHRDFPFRPHGRYGGFDKSVLSTSSLTLFHDQTGKDRLPLILDNRANVGCWVTRQGLLVTEDEAIVLPIAENTGNDPRIDIIVGSHEYLELQGGLVASYSVVSGVPAASPVAPAVLNDQKDVILGYVMVEGSGTSDDLPEYLPANTPDFAGDISVAHKDRNQEYNAIQAFKTFQLVHCPTVAEFNGDTFELVLPTYVAENGKKYLYSEYTITENASTKSIAHGNIRTIVHDAEELPEYLEIKLLCLSPTFFSGDHFKPSEYRIGANKWLVLKTFLDNDPEVNEDYWWIIGDEKIANENTRLNSMLVFNNQDVTISSGVLTTGFNGQKSNNWNFLLDDIVEGTSGTDNHIKFLPTKNWSLDDTFDKANYRGSWVTIDFDKTISVGSVVLKHNATGSGVLNKPLLLPFNEDMIIAERTAVLVVETATHWKVIGVNGYTTEAMATVIKNSSLFSNPWVACDLVTTNGYSVVEGAEPYFRISGKTIYLRGQIDIDASVYWNTLQQGQTATTSLFTNTGFPLDREARIPVKIVSQDYPATDTERSMILFASALSGSFALNGVAAFDGLWRLYLDGISLDIHNT